MKENNIKKVLLLVLWDVIICRMKSLNLKDENAWPVLWNI